MRPLHPCPMCGHETTSGCRTVALSVPPTHRTSCLHCFDDCVVAAARLPGRFVPHDPPPVTPRPFWVPESPLVPLAAKAGVTR